MVPTARSRTATRVTRLLGPAILGALAMLAGCASVKETPQQAYVWEMGRICDSRSNTWYMDKVEADGSYTIRGATNSVGGPNLPYFQCMNEQFKAHPFFDWAKARNRDAQPPVAAVGSKAPDTLVSPGPVTVPTWKVGDEWQFAYKSPSGSGTYVWTVDRLDMLDGVQHYVIRARIREIFIRVSDLASSLARDNGVVVTRETPSRLDYDWPLTVGKSWAQSYRFERPAAGQSADRNRVWTVDAEETVTIVSGTFRTVKISQRNKNTNRLIREVWYAPDAKQPVKARDFLSAGIREEELIAYRFK